MEQNVNTWVTQSDYTGTIATDGSAEALSATTNGALHVKIVDPPSVFVCAYNLYAYDSSTCQYASTLRKPFPEEISQAKWDGAQYAITTEVAIVLFVLGFYTIVRAIAESTYRRMKKQK
jgi:hypothetical protein